MAFGESLAEASFGTGTMSLPNAVVNNTDISYGEEIQDANEIEPAYPHRLHEIREIWWKEKLKEAMASDTLKLELISKINEQVDKAPDHAIASFYTPILAQDIRVTNNVRSFFSEVQLKSNTDAVNSLDMPSANMHEIEEMLKADKRTIENASKEPFFEIDMWSHEGAFESKANLATGYMGGITAIWRDPLRYFKNFQTLASLNNTPVLRHLTNVEPLYPLFTGKSAILPNALLCADTISLKLGMGGTKKRVRANARRLDIATSGYLKIRQHRREHGDNLLHYCPICRDNTMADLLIDFREHLYPAFRVHDAHALYDIVDEARDKINSGQLLQFLRNKKFGRKVVDEVFRVGQAPLTVQMQTV